MGRSQKRWQPETPTSAGFVLVMPLVALLVTLVVYPLGKLVADSLAPPEGFNNYLDFFRSNANRRALANTLELAAIVTVCAVGLGSILAWWLRSSESRSMKAALWIAVMTPFCLSIILKNYAFIFLLGRRGVVNHLLQIAGLIDQPRNLLFTPGAVVLGMLYTMLPYAVLPIYAAFRSVDLDLVRAAEGLGASRTGALASVLIPLSIPGLLAASVLTFVISLGFYVTPILLGGAGSPFVANVIADEIFRSYNYGGAAAAATMLLVLALVILGLARRLVGRDRLQRAA